MIHALLRELLELVTIVVFVGVALAYLPGMA